MATKVQVTKKSGCYSYPPSFAADMVGLINEWRDQVPELTTRRGRPDTDRLDEFLRQYENAGLSAYHLTYVVLGCEWALRWRKCAPDDVRVVLNRITTGLSGEHRILGHFDAHLIVKVLEPALRRELEPLYIPLALGPAFDNPDFYLAQMLRIRPDKQRTRPRTFVRSDQGPLALSGPILAGLVVAEVIEQSRPEIARHIGIELVSALRSRDVQDQEFRRWRKIARDTLISVPGSDGTPQPTNIVAYITAQARAAYQQTFVFRSDHLSVDQLMQKCRDAPQDVLFWFSQRALLDSIFSIRWSGAKNPAAQTKKKRRIS